MAVKDQRVMVVPLDTKKLEVGGSKVVQAAVKTANMVLADAIALEIRTPEDYEVASTKYTAIKSHVDAIEDERTAVTAPINAFLKKWNAMFTPPKEIYNRAALALGGKITTFRRQQEAAARKLQEELDAKVRREQEALAKAAEKKAAKLESKGDLEGAAAARENVPVVEAPVVTPDLPSTGLNFRKDYVYEIVNRDLIPDEYWTLNEKMLGATVRAQKLECRIPGIKVIEKDVPVRSGAGGEEG